MSGAGERERAFCAFCGALIGGRVRYVEGYPRCAAHHGLPAEQPRDEREKLPTMDQEYARELGRGGA